MQVPNQYGGKSTFMPFQNEVNICCIAEIKKDDREVAALIYEMNGCYGITINDEEQYSSGGPGFLNAVASFGISSALRPPDRQRTYYFVQIPPVFNVSRVGAEVADKLRSLHHQNVRFVDGCDYDDPFKIKTPSYT